VKVDGASTWQARRYVLIPMLKQVLVVALIIRTIGGSGPSTPSWSSPTAARAGDRGG
jgi:hypothetical protein